MAITALSKADHAEDMSRREPDLIQRDASLIRRQIKGLQVLGEAGDRLQEFVVHDSARPGTAM